MSPHSSVRNQDKFSLYKLYNELIQGKFQFIKKVICCLYFKILSHIFLVLRKASELYLKVIQPSKHLFESI